MRRLFLLTLVAIALFTKTAPGSAHEYSRFGTVESLVERGTLQLDDSIFIGTVDKVFRDGHFYSHQPPLLAVIEAPVYWVLRTPGIRFNNRGRFLITYLFILLTNGVALALTVVVFAKLLELSGVSPPARDLWAVLLVTGTWLLPYGLVSNNHGISALLTAVLIWQLLLVEWRGVTTARAAAIGAAVGLLVAIELLPVVSFLPLTLIYLATRKDVTRQQWMLVATGISVPLLVEAALNVRVTGDVIPAGFHHELFNYPGSVFDETSLTGNVKFESWSALFAYAWASLFAGKGFFTFAPLLLVAFIAGLIEWRWWSRARAVHLLLLAAIVLSVGTALVTTNNFGGEAVGFRHGVFLAPAFLALLLPWICEPSPIRRNGLMAVACASVLSMVIFAMRQPWSVLSLSFAPIGSWDQYLPIVARIVFGDLFSP